MYFHFRQVPIEAETHAVLLKIFVQPVSGLPEEPSSVAVDEEFHGKMPQITVPVPYNAGQIFLIKNFCLFVSVKSCERWGLVNMFYLS